MTDETNIPKSARKDPLLPEVLVNNPPEGVDQKKWVDMVRKGREFDLTPPGDEKAEMALKIAKTFKGDGRGV